jgi:hypothetical protein
MEEMAYYQYYTNPFDDEINIVSFVIFLAALAGWFIFAVVYSTYWSYKKYYCIQGKPHQEAIQVDIERHIFNDSDDIESDWSLHSIESKYSINSINSEKLRKHDETVDHDTMSI